jgi:hypothetical protein
MTSAFGTHSLLLSERFDGISDSINWLGVHHLFDTGGPARRGIGSIRAQNEARCDTIRLLWSRARDGLRGYLKYLLARLSPLCDGEGHYSSTVLYR